MNLSREWIGRGVVLLALVATVGLPFALRTDQQPRLRADDTVIVITPHNEAIRSEFTRGFTPWYFARTGRQVAIDWRVIGGTSEIARYLDGEFTESFKLHWTRQLQRPWTPVVERSFDDRNVRPDDSPADDTEAEAARRAFLASEATSGIDIFFGGGSYDFIQQANAGRLLDAGIFARRPEWFTPDVIPQSHNGEPFWATDHSWIGAVVSSFGFVFNRDSLERLGIENEPRDWRDLIDPRLRGELALADPTKSGSIAKAFEMVIQREMQVRQRELRAAGVAASEAEHRAVREGWRRGLELLQLMGANARYFTDTSQKPPIDVSQGEAAVGMCIDFYGRTAAENAGNRSGQARLEFVTPPSGSVYSVDPIALLRGAPHRTVASEFIEYVLSLEGQDLWNFRAGTPGGPTTYALRRLPVRKDSYTPERRVHMSDPTVSPFGDDNDFFYNTAWTGRMLTDIAFVIRVMCLDTHEELAAAWRTIIAAGQPAEAMAVLQDLSAIDYDQTAGPIHERLVASPLEAVRLGKELAAKFRAQYAQAAEIARRSAPP